MAAVLLLLAGWFLSGRYRIAANLGIAFPVLPILVLGSQDQVLVGDFNAWS